jgi:CheY-like chemotaxis protein
MAGRRSEEKAAGDALLLLVEPSSFLREMLSPVLKASGQRVQPAADFEEGRKLAQSLAFTTVLVDLDRDPDAALQFATDLRARPELRLRIIGMTSLATPELHLRAAEAGIEAFPGLVRVKHAGARTENVLVIAGQAFGQPASTVAQIRMIEMRQFMHCGPVAAQGVVIRIPAHVQQHAHFAAALGLAPWHRTGIAAVDLLHPHVGVAQGEPPGRGLRRFGAFTDPALQQVHARGVVDIHHLDPQRAVPGLQHARVGRREAGQ